MKLNEQIKKVEAFAPATSANLGVGFDILGFTLEKLGDFITLERRDDKKLVIEHITSQDPLPIAVEKNTASVVIKKLLEDYSLDIGFSISIKKQIPLSSGLGGSAASAVGALIALNAFFTEPLPIETLVRYASMGEAVCSGYAHLDNVVPCLYGGLTLISSTNPFRVLHLPIPNVFTVIVHPHLQIETKMARNILQKEVPLKKYVEQSSNLASAIVAIYENNFPLLRHAMNDVIIEPQRAHLLPHFSEAKHAALQQGAINVSISGSGPSLFSWVETLEQAQQVQDAINKIFQNNHILTDSWTSRINQRGAHIISIEKKDK